MENKKRLKNRTPLNNAVRNELYESLKKLSDETMIPMSKLLDEALEDLLKKRNI